MIIGLHGDLGSGKTALMSLLVHYFMVRFKCRIMSNYGLKFPHELIDVNNIGDSYNVVIALDELTTILDCRNSATQFNKDFSYFILQTRKRNVVFIYTAQFKGSVDKRIRNIQDIVIYCFKKNGKLHYYFMPSSETQVKHFSIPLDYAVPVFKKLYNTNEIITPICLKKKG